MNVLITLVEDKETIAGDDNCRIAVPSFVHERHTLAYRSILALKYGRRLL